MVKECNHKIWTYEYISCCNQRFKCDKCGKLTKAPFGNGEYFRHGDKAKINEDGFAYKLTEKKAA